MKTGKKITSVINADPEEKKKKGGGEKKTSLADKFYRSKAYAGHVRRSIKRNKKKLERRNSGGGPLFKTDAGYKRYDKRKDRQRNRKKDISNYLKGGSQRRQERKAKRSNAGQGGGFTCSGVVCDG